MTPLDCTDLRRRAGAPRPLMAEDFYERHMVAAKAEILALLDLAKRLEAALLAADDEMGCAASGEYAHDPDVMKKPCPGCAAEIAVKEALAAAKEAKL